MHQFVTRFPVALAILLFNLLSAGCGETQPTGPSDTDQIRSLIEQRLDEQQAEYDAQRAEFEAQQAEYARRDRLYEAREARLAHPIVTPPTETAVSPVLMTALVDWIQDESATRNVLLRELDYIGGRVIFRSNGTRYTAAYHPPMAREDGTVYREASISFWARPDGTSGQDTLRTWDAYVNTGLANFGIGPEPYQYLFNGENCKSEDLQVCVDMGACEDTSDCIHKMFDEDFGCEPPIEFRCEPEDALHWQQEHAAAMQVAKRLFRLEE